MSENFPPAQPQNPTPAQAPMTPMAPPAPQWSAQVPQWSTPPRVQSTRGLAIAALIMGGIALLFTMALAATSFSAAAQLKEAYDVGGSPDDVLTGYDLLAIPWILSMIAAWVLTAIWLGKARANVATIRPGFHFRRSPAWDWLGWFIPIVSFWFPHQIVADLGKGSSPSMKQYRWIGVWWAAWVAGLVASRAGDSVALAGDGANVGALPLFAVAHAVVWTIAFALWVKIVMSIVRDQEYATSAR